MEIKELIQKLEEAEDFKNEVQAELLTWCKDKSNPLKERFKIWEKYIDKKEESTNFNNPTYPKYIQRFENSFENRYMFYEYTFFLPQLEDEGSYDHEIDILCNEYNVQYFFQLHEEVQDEFNFNNPMYAECAEWLIQENFGGFTYDW